MTYPWKDEVDQFGEFFDDPRKERGMIAPGMSLSMTVRFCASSFSEFRDEITFISEENVFKVTEYFNHESKLYKIFDANTSFISLMYFMFI